MALPVPVGTNGERLASTRVIGVKSIPLAARATGESRASGFSRVHIIRVARGCLGNELSETIGQTGVCMIRPRAIASVIAVLGLADCSGGSAFSLAASNGAGTGGASTAGGTDSGGNANTGGTTSTGGTGDPNAGGYGAMSCDQLKAAYLAELATAKTCSPGSTTELCSAHVNQSVPCGCSTFVSSGRTGAISNLSKILAAYTNGSCPLCTNPVVCNPAASATCVATGTSTAGKCVDGPITTTGVGTGIGTGTTTN
jgi:hypothetical protein